MGFLPVKLQFLAVQWCVRLGVTWARLWARRLESKHCHSRVAGPHVIPDSLYVTQRFNTAASLSYPGPNIALCTSSSFSFSFFDDQSKSSQDPAMMKSSPCTTISKSRDACPNARGQLSELSGPMSFRTKYCHLTAARSVQHRSMIRQFGSSRSYGSMC